MCIEHTKKCSELYWNSASFGQLCYNEHVWQKNKLLQALDSVTAVCERAKQGNIDVHLINKEVN